MRLKLTAIFLLLFATSYAQTETFEALMESAKAEFAKEFDEQDYSSAVNSLEKAVKLKPSNTEAIYYLGYAYSRLNSKDARGVINMRLNLVQASSAQFEKVNALTPEYTGDFLLLDPYSKIMSEWGSMAMCYTYHNKPDSALWAFREGKERGGFSDYLLDVNRRVLKSCSRYAILIVSGDAYTMPLWYLQRVEGLRNDISVVNIDMLNTEWYPELLAKQNSVTFDDSNEEIKAWEYIEWKSSKVTIGEFSWEVAPSYYDNYLLRGDRVFMSLLRSNKFERDIFFTKGFYEPSRLSLSAYLSSCVYSDRLRISENPSLTHEEYLARFRDQLLLIQVLNRNSKTELQLYDNVRKVLLDQVLQYLADNDQEKAKELLLVLETYGNEKLLPYMRESLREYEHSLRSRVE